MHVQSGHRALGQGTRSCALCRIWPQFSPALKRMQFIAKAELDAWEGLEEIPNA